LYLDRQRLQKHTSAALPIRLRIGQKIAGSVYVPEYDDL